LFLDFLLRFVDRPPLLVEPPLKRLRIGFRNCRKGA
jgi:hypothetical protein